MGIPSHRIQSNLYAGTWSPEQLSQILREYEEFNAETNEQNYDLV